MSNLPNKWAVRITSLEDAMLLTLLFPFGNNAILAYKSGFASNGNWYPFALDFKKGKFSWATKDYFEENGYTILTLNELKELL